MTAPAGKLKHPSGWFAAGWEVSRALGLLSDGAFRLFIYLCLNADRLMGIRRCVASSFAPADEKLANALFQRGISIRQVERGFLLGCARKYATLLNNKSNELIVSVSYFQNVIEEAGELQMPEDYWRYLQLRIDQMERQWLEQTQASGEGKFNKRLIAPMSGRI